MLWLTSISPFSIWCVRKKRFHRDLVYLEPNFSYLLIQIYFTCKSHWFGDSHEMGSVSLKIGDGTVRFIRFCYVLIRHNKYNQSLCPWFFLFLKGKEIVLGSFQPVLMLKTQCLFVYSWHNKHRPETVYTLFNSQICFFIFQFQWEGVLWLKLMHYRWLWPQQQLCSYHIWTCWN